MINIHDYYHNNIKNIHVNILYSWRAWLINDGNRESEDLFSFSIFGFVDHLPTTFSSQRTLARVEGWEKETTWLRLKFETYGNRQ